jgi:hypothetical protein
MKYVAMSVLGDSSLDGFSTRIRNNSLGVLSSVSGEQHQLGYIGLM